MGSVFRILGTPNETSWPVCLSTLSRSSLSSLTHICEIHQESATLPDFKKIKFFDMTAQPLAELLPNLPVNDDKHLVVDLISKLLVYSAAKRLQVRRALKHPWFKTTADASTNQTEAVQHLIAPWLHR